MRNIAKQSKANLKRGNPAWVKGVSGNPNGRAPKIVCVTSWLKEYADTKISLQLDVKTLTYAQAAALSAWRAAAKGDLPTYDFIINRIEGKVVQKVQAEENVTIKYRAEDLTDDQLATVLTRGSSRVAAPSVGPVSAN